MLINKRLILAHFWLAFAVFGLALLLGAWQMFLRSPLNAWHFNPEFYYRSVTAHGSAMGYVFPTLIGMGFGYAITELSLIDRSALHDRCDGLSRKLDGDVPNPSRGARDQHPLARGEPAVPKQRLLGSQPAHRQSCRLDVAQPQRLRC